MLKEYKTIPTNEFRDKQAKENNLYWCSHCKEFRLKEEFYKSSNKFNYGLQYKCKNCNKKVRKRTRTKYLKNNKKGHPKKCSLCNSGVKTYDVVHRIKPFAYTKRYKKCKECGHNFYTVELKIKLEDTNIIETIKLLLDIEYNEK